MSPACVRTIFHKFQVSFDNFASVALIGHLFEAYMISEPKGKLE